MVMKNKQLGESEGREASSQAEHLMSDQTRPRENRPQTYQMEYIPKTQARSRPGSKP